MSRADLVKNADHAQATLGWINQNLALYQSKYREYRRGSLPAGQAGERVTTSRADNVPLRFTQDGQAHGFDPVDEDLNRRHSQICAAIERARLELDGIQRLMLGVIAVAEPMEDPLPKGCANAYCNVVFSMIGRDKPQDYDGRCNACRMFYRRNQRERRPMASDQAQMERILIEEQSGASHTQ